MVTAASLALGRTFPSLTEGESVPTWHSTHEGFGIDRLSISFPVRDWATGADRESVGADGSFSAQWRLRHGASVGARVKEVGAFVSVMQVAGQPWGKVECNPARFADPEGCSLLPVTQLDAAFSVMWAAACEVTDPEWCLGDAIVKRIDVARDFRGITSPALYVEGLSRNRPTYARRKGLWHDAGAGGAQTLHVGSAAGMVRLYDQHAAYAEKGAPEGSLRFEVEARSGWLEKAGARTVGSLDPVLIERVALERWEWSKMGTTVTGPVNAVEVLQGEVRSGRVKQAVADRLLGAMVRQSFGYGGASRRSEYRYRDVSDRLGLTAEALWSDDLSRQASGRLDFETGTEFLALSA